MARGRVKWFNSARGFGMIESLDGDDIFVHYSSILAEGYKSLLEGDEVEFDVYDTSKGPLARNVISDR